MYKHYINIISIIIIILFSLLKYYYYILHKKGITQRLFNRDMKVTDFPQRSSNTSIYRVEC